MSASEDLEDFHNWYSVQVHVLVDENADFVASHDLDLLADLEQEHIGGNASMCRRLITVNIRVQLPRPVELKCEAPMESGARVGKVVDGGTASTSKK